MVEDIHRKTSKHRIAAVGKNVSELLLTSRWMMDMQFKFVLGVPADGRRME